MPNQPASKSTKPKITNASMEQPSKARIYPPGLPANLRRLERKAVFPRRQVRLPYGKEDFSKEM
jgi:hypothetical protein